MLNGASATGNMTSVNTAGISKGKVLSRSKKAVLAHQAEHDAAWKMKIYVGQGRLAAEGPKQRIDGNAWATKNWLSWKTAALVVDSAVDAKGTAW